MAEKGTQDPTTGTETDISKAQAQQQPPAQASQQQPESGEQRGEFETGEAETGQPGEELQGDTLAPQRTDIEGATLPSQEKGEAESGFVGAEGQQDTSSGLVEDDDEEFDEGGESAP